MSDGASVKRNGNVFRVVFRSVIRIVFSSGQFHPRIVLIISEGGSNRAFWHFSHHPACCDRNEQQLAGRQAAQKKAKRTKVHREKGTNKVN